MNIRNVETFLAVVRLKTLKAASGHLHISQSSVSKRLQVLEEECGIMLFERGKGGKEATLTAAGERFMDIAERMVEMFQEVKGFTERENHVLAVGAVTSLHAVFMPSLFAKLIEHEPLMQLSAVTLHSAEMYEAIDRKTIDVGFSLMQRAHPNVMVRQCFSEPILVMQPAEAGAETQGEAYDTVQLEHLDFAREIYFPWTPYYESRHRQWSPTGSPRVFVDDPTMLASLLRRPGQWAFVPLSMARHYQEMRPFKLSYPYPKPPDRVCYQLTHKQPDPGTKAALAVFTHHLGSALDAMFGKERNGKYTKNT